MQLCACGGGDYRPCQVHILRRTEQHKSAHYNNNFWCIYHNKTHTYTVYGSAILHLLFLPHYYNNVCVCAYALYMMVVCVRDCVYECGNLFAWNETMAERRQQQVFVCSAAAIHSQSLFLLPIATNRRFITEKNLYFWLFSSVAGLFLLQFGSAVLVALCMLRIEFCMSFFAITWYYIHVECESCKRHLVLAVSSVWVRCGYASSSIKV